MKKTAEIRSIFAAVALFSFLLVELFSFVQGYSLTTILIRGVGVYLGVIVLGVIFLIVVKNTNVFKNWPGLEKEDETESSSLDIKIDDSFAITQEQEKETYDPMEDIKKAVAKNPREIAHAIRKMMGQKQ